MMVGVDRSSVLLRPPKRFNLFILTLSGVLDFKESTLLQWLLYNLGF